jgi:poly-gamma-glutamate synthesis protein (capsule biosynthesis protein)
MQGRPGLSPLHVDAAYRVPSDAYEQVQELADALGLEAIKERAERLGFPVPGEDEDGFTFINTDGTDIQFVEGDDYGVELEPDEDDVDAIIEQIRAADRQADWVIANLHGHEGQGGLTNDHSIPEFYETFAHACIDAGADAFVGHGPHVLRGIEVYDGAPVFYSLGDFLMQNETVTRLPTEIYDRYELESDVLPPTLFDERVFDEDGERAGFLGDSAFWESVLPICRYEDGELRQIELHPLDLGFEASRPQRGRPLLAEGETAEKIFTDLERLSEPYGTEIEVENGTGIIQI